tara:strand:+ start:405 stop:653 length:249 start_codon:yes stop_codon:yes gene_type:complete
MAGGVNMSNGLTNAVQSIQCDAEDLLQLITLNIGDSLNLSESIDCSQCGENHNIKQMFVEVLGNIIEEAQGLEKSFEFVENN